MPSKKYHNIMSTVAAGKGDTMIPEKYKKYFKRKKHTKRRAYPYQDIV